MRWLDQPFTADTATAGGESTGQVLRRAGVPAGPQHALDLLGHLTHVGRRAVGHQLPDASLTMITVGFQALPGGGCAAAETHQRSLASRTMCTSATLATGKPRPHGRQGRLTARVTSIREGAPFTDVVGVALEVLEAAGPTVQP